VAARAFGADRPISARMAIALCSKRRDKHACARPTHLLPAFWQAGEQLRECSSVTLDPADPTGDERLLLSDIIRTTLTDEIASGSLPPGTPLDEQVLAARFGASRTPVREALRQLIFSGLVEQPTRRGLVVARVTLRRIMALFETMAEIDALCARMATTRMNPFERGALLDLQAGFDEAVHRQDRQAYETYDTTFHETIYRATHNEVLAEQAVATRTRLNIFRRSQLRDDGRVMHSRLEHAGVLDAMAEGDGELAARRMRAHMLNAAARFGHYISIHGPDGNPQDQDLFWAPPKPLSDS